MKRKNAGFKPFVLWMSLFSMALACNSFACSIEANHKNSVLFKERVYHVDGSGALKFSNVIVRKTYDKKTMPPGLLQIMRNLSGEARGIPSLHREEAAIFRPKN